jgi:hypothetical protein
MIRFISQIIISIRHHWKYRFNPIYRKIYDEEFARELKLLIEAQEHEILFGKSDQLS